jgi:hypothetical protein
MISTPISDRRTALVTLLLLVWAVRLWAQSVAVSTVGDAVHVRAPGFVFIKDETLARLKDGRSVRVDLEVAVLPKPGATAVARSRQVFVLSYDLWEERFAVTQATGPQRSISHLTASGAEAWCIGQLAVPVTALGRLGRDQPLWVRLEYRILDGDGAPRPEEGTGLTLRGLIDVLSRRRTANAPTHSIEAGPLRLRE